MRYDVWVRDKWGGKSDAEATFATLDTAILSATKLSKGAGVTFVLDKNQNPSTVRGFGMNGVWYPAVDNCKKCNNAAHYQWEDECKACKTASWKHIRN